ncbi:class I SAM-dependent methyltransferase [Lysobacter niastensis]|uniref:Methyltransferase domain-containing protein n=1 Tax=Lysobacter niastensis TaxID=380629 RepID=A0ABS0BAX9_9GAMM|nr:class I SAM-dependent methyltransferase [Lysobacter niastensis]MBF6025982.1 methyltransferase domain-containing protein [Lysobacter niastensis]
MTTQHNDHDLEFTGERFLPEVSGQIAFEHLHRYYFAKRLVAGLDVLDVACGEGYGSDIISKAARSVVGVDIAPDAVMHASARYAGDNLRFVEASAASLPFADAQFDAVVSFETIEHHDKHEEMMAEVRRVLKPDGILIISSPNKLHYSIEPGYSNPYHVKELFREEFVALVGRHFRHAALFGQRVVHGSLMVGVDAGSTAVETLKLDRSELTVAGGLARPLYDLLVASDAALPPVSGSLFETTVHGMDPAGFYGVHLPERVNNADRRIGLLESELEAAQLVSLPAASVQAKLDQLIEGQRAAAPETQAKLDQLLEGQRTMAPEVYARLDKRTSDAEEMHAKLNRLLQARETEAILNADIRRLSGDLEAALDRLSAASQRLESVSASHADLESAVRMLETQLEVSHARLQEDETVLSEVRQALAERDAEVRELRNSFSWRSTSWLRALSNVLGGRR